MATFTITSANSIFETSKIGFHEASNSVPDTLNILEGGYIISLNSNLGARLGGGGAWTVNLHGSIFAQNDHALFLTNDSGPEPTSKITIGASGQIASGGNYAIQSFTSVNITNAGVLLAGGSTVISLNGSKGASSVMNSGTIGSEGQTYGINAFTTADNIKVTNSGTIFGTIDLAIGNDSVTNSGTIFGNLVLDDGNDVVTNTGSIEGHIDLGEGNNRYTSTKANASVLNIVAGAGNDVVSNAGEMDIVNLGEGNNSITHANKGHAELLLTGSGNDTFLINGFVRQYVQTGDGKNTVTIGATGHLFNVNSNAIALIMGTGDDTFTNSGTIDGGVNAGLGNNIGTNKGLIDGDVLIGNGRQIFQ